MLGTVVDSLVWLCRCLFCTDIHDPQRHFSSIDKETCSEADMQKVTQLVHSRVKTQVTGSPLQRDIQTDRISTGEADCPLLADA